jgi:hypothetical protein
MQKAKVDVTLTGVTKIIIPNSKITEDKIIVSEK